MRPVSFFMRPYSPSPFRHLVWPLFALAVALMALPRAARADRVDKLMSQLEHSDDYKVRLSAALTLAKIGSQRSISAFIVGLRDRDKTVRGVSAASLGKLVNQRTPSRTRKRALSALRHAATHDKNAFVKKQAVKAYRAVKRIGSTPAPRAGGTYVNIGSMAAKAGNRSSMRALMRKTAVKTFKQRASSYLVAWPGGGAPSKRALASKKMKAFHVDGTLTALETDRHGSTTLVSCKVSMLLATYPEKSMFGFLKGGAKVQAGSSEREVRYAAEDCVAAVVQDLVGRKIIPTIKSRTR